MEIQRKVDFTEEEAQADFERLANSLVEVINWEVEWTHADQVEFVKTHLGFGFSAITATKHIRHMIAQLLHKEDPLEVPNAISASEREKIEKLRASIASGKLRELYFLMHQENRQLRGKESVGLLLGETAEAYRELTGLTCMERVPHTETELYYLDVAAHCFFLMNFFRIREYADAGRHDQYSLDEGDEMGGLEDIDVLISYHFNAICHTIDQMLDRKMTGRFGNFNSIGKAIEFLWVQWHRRRFKRTLPDLPVTEAAA